MKPAVLGHAPSTDGPGSGAVATESFCSSSRGIWGAVGLLLAMQAGLLAYSATRHSPTRNEPAHLVAGLSHWRFGRYELYRVNPPPVHYVAALPMLAAGYEADLAKPCLAKPCLAQPRQIFGIAYGSNSLMSTRHPAPHREAVFQQAAGQASFRGSEMRQSSPSGTALTATRVTCHAAQRVTGRALALISDVELVWLAAAGYDGR